MPKPHLALIQEAKMTNVSGNVTCDWSGGPIIIAVGVSVLTMLTATCPPNH
jgi:hypothetical protein